MENMPYLKRFFGHLHTINHHKRLVRSMCFKCGMIKQGIMHDLTKYNPIEFFSGVKYYQGYRSPISKEREINGYSLGWLHHEGKNKHHFEYWVDKDYKELHYYVIHMPFNYLLEGVIDKIAASKNYNKENYSDDSAYNFLMNGKDQYLMGDDNLKRTLYLLKYLKDNGEEKALKYYKELYRSWKKDKNFDINL